MDGQKIKRSKNIMAQSTYQSVVLAKRPTGQIVPGETFEKKENPMVTEADLKDDEVLVEVLYLSLDPAMRGWLNGTYLLPFFSFHISQDWPCG
jgi:NADPH-dependent curcumin reductase CurA